MDNRLLETVVETMREGLLVVDTRGIILAVNPAFESMTGYSSSHLVGKSCRILNCTGCTIFNNESGKPWCGLFLKRRIQDRRCRITARDGRTLCILKQASVLHDEKGCVTGAVEALTDISEMVRKEEEIHSLRSTLRNQDGVVGIVGNSQAVLNLLRLVENVALSDAPVLILGESGVGKELVARAIHECGGRAERNFIKVNCSSLNENLLESELFGHVRGAFTGADKVRVGRFEAASDGSIFLDEIGDVSPAIQVKLLRVLESKEVERVGDHQPIQVNARIISATNRDLDRLVAEGIFREDLFYRISVVPIRVPSLRERKEDIPLLAQVFIDRIAERDRRQVTGLSSKAIEYLMAYDWPGNVRELRNTIEYAFVLCPDSLIEPEHLPPRIRDSEGCWQSPEITSKRSLPEREALINALRKSGGSRSEAARLLGVSRVTVWKRMKKFGLE